MLNQHGNMAPMPRWNLRLAVWATTVAALAIPALIAAIRRPNIEMSDLALIEIRVHDVLSAHPPLSGAYSRAGWSHPGPMQFYVLAIPQRVLGGGPRGLHLAMLLLSVAWIVAIAWAIRRAGTAVSVLTAGAVIVLVHGHRPLLLIDTWNPAVTVLATMTMLICCWRALDGDVAALGIAFVAWSFAAQAHVTALVVLTPLMAVTAIMAVRQRRSALRASKTLLIGVGATVVAWLPVVIDVLLHRGGNPWRLLRWGSAPGEQRIAASSALRLLARFTSPETLSDLRFDEVTPFVRPSLGIAPGLTLVALAATWYVARRRGDRSVVRLTGVCALVWAAGAVATFSTRAEVYGYLFRWVGPLVVCTWLATAVLLSHAAAAVLDRRWLRLGLATILVAAAPLAGLGAPRTSSATLHFDDSAPVALAFTRHIAATEMGPVLVRPLGGGDNWLTMFGLHAAVVGGLVDRGVDVRVDPAWARQMGSHRVGRGGEVLYVLRPSTDPSAAGCSVALTVEAAAADLPAYALDECGTTVSPGR